MEYVQNIKIKAEFAGGKLLCPLAEMWRLRREGEEQPIEETEGYWRSQIEAGHFMHRTIARLTEITAEQSETSHVPVSATKVAPS